MPQHLVLLVLLQVGALTLLWLIRAPDRVLYLFVLLLLVPLGLGEVHGQMLEVAYLVVPGLTVLYLVDRAVRRGEEGPRRSGRTGMLVLALLFFAVVFANFFRRPIVPFGVTDLGREPAGIHAWMGFGLSLCYFVVFAGVTFSAPARTEKVLKFAGWLCLALCLFGFAVVFVPAVRGPLSLLADRGLVSANFFMAGKADAAASRFVDEFGQYRVGTLDVAAALLLIVGLTFLRSWPARAALGIFAFAALFLSGGRSVLAGAVAGVLAWFLVTQKLRVTLAFALLLVAALAGVFALSDDAPPLLRRSTSLVTGRALQAEPRVELFAQYAKSIEEHPLEGVGFGAFRKWSDKSRTRFLQHGLRHGGHGTYMSVLYLFGLIAFLPFLALLGLGIHASRRAYLDAPSPPVRRVGLLGFVFLVYYLFPMVAGGNGGEPALHAVLGIVSGLAARADAG